MPPARPGELVVGGASFWYAVSNGADHTYIHHLAYVRRRCWDFLVRELMGTQPPTIRPALIPIDPQLLAELFT